MKYFLMICFLTITMTGCYNTLLPIRIPTKNPDIPINSIKKDIPRYPNNRVYVYYKLAKQKQKQLNLSIPENGSDSLLIRFWFTYPESLHQFAELVELKIDSNKTPKASYTKMRIFFNPTRDCEVINRHRDTLVTPKCGWTCLMDSVKKLGIIKLPTIESIPRYKEMTGNKIGYDNDYLTLAVEVSTPKEYRFFQYNNFEGFKSIDEVNRLFRFTLFLREQLDLVKNDQYWYGK